MVRSFSASSSRRAEISPCVIFTIADAFPITDVAFAPPMFTVDSPLSKKIAGDTPMILQMLSSIKQSMVSDLRSREK